jgi:DNA-binding transcriptional ArsR family regulator
VSESATGLAGGFETESAGGGTVDGVTAGETVMEDATAVFDLLSDETRVRIVAELAAARGSVTPRGAPTRERQDAPEVAGNDNTETTSHDRSETTSHDKSETTSHDTRETANEDDRSARAEGGLRFSTLRSRVGVTDSGRFNYHLNRLRETLVRKVDGRYVLTDVGCRVAATLDAVGGE